MGGYGMTIAQVGLNPGTLALCIPILIFMIPIVAILTSHQRKMAEIVHSRKQTDSSDIDALRREVYELKQLIHQQAIAVDNLLTRQTVPIAPPADMEKRLGS